jgi:cytochrome oxidase assembly protein ShyY1
MPSKPEDAAHQRSRKQMRNAIVVMVLTFAAFFILVALAFWLGHIPIH